MQLTSFYQPGSFVPHVRMMDTGRQNPDLGCEFGLPYVYVRTPRDYDQTTLNYNWQLCGTQAYSLYAGKTREIDEAAADQSAARHRPLPQQPRGHPQRNRARPRRPPSSPTRI